MHFKNLIKLWTLKDWEFPASRGGIPDDKPNFTLFVQELRFSVNNESLSNSKQEKILISAAVAAGKEQIDKGYQVKEFVKELDFINLMA